MKHTNFVNSQTLDDLMLMAEMEQMLAADQKRKGKRAARRSRTASHCSRKANDFARKYGVSVDAHRFAKDGCPVHKGELFTKAEFEDICHFGHESSRKANGKARQALREYSKVNKANEDIMADIIYREVKWGMFCLLRDGVDFANGFRLGEDNDLYVEVSTKEMVPIGIYISDEEYEEFYNIIALVVDEVYRRPYLREMGWVALRHEF